jgi:hypothetical protein
MHIFITNVYDHQCVKLRRSFLFFQQWIFSNKKNNPIRYKKHTLNNYFFEVEDELDISDEYHISKYNASHNSQKDILTMPNIINNRYTLFC